MNLKSNIALASIVSAGILALFAGKIADAFVQPQHLKEDAVKIEATEVSAGGGSAVAMPEPILAMIAAADVERGKGVAKACTACHKFEQGGGNGVGPELAGIVGAKKMSHAGFEYSGALNEQGGDVWTYAELNKFLWKPKAYSKGTKMNFIGVKKPEDRAALIAYLRTVSGNPAAPSQADIDAEAKELGPKEAAPPADATAPVEAEAPKAEEKKEEPKAEEVKK
jgi:cytochrome c